MVTTEILLDGPMKGVFGCDSFTFFTMQKYIGAHIHPFKPVDLETSPRKRKAAPRKKPASDTKKRKGPKQPIWILSQDLTAIVGQDRMSRPKVVQKIWEYIRAHDLQNPKDKRQIICDTMLQKVMKKSKVTMFNMNAALSAHFLEKVEGEFAPTQEEEDNINTNANVDL